jgi:hypothetical protein
MRRVFSISVIALAVITLLVSVIVPHHHHGNMVCIVASHCEHECNNAGYDCEGDFSDCRHHQHDNDNKDGQPFHNNCIARANYVVSDQSEVKYKLRTNDEDNHNPHFAPVFLYLTDLYDTAAKIVYLTKHRYRDKGTFPESANVNRINGLRAPPYSIRISRS